jgi:uncharacterized membrane protein YfcA
MTPDLSIPLMAFLSLAGFAAGFIDSIGGGGGLISLPALLAAGLPPYLALGTNKFQSTLGTGFALFNFHRKAKVVWRTAFIGVPFALIGSVVGTRLALIISQAILAKVLIILLPPAAILIFVSKRFMKPNAIPAGVSAAPAGKYWRGGLVHLSGQDSREFLIISLVCLIIGAYDGFFGPGTGTFLIVALILFARLTPIKASATAKTFNLASNFGSFVMFIASGHVYYAYAAGMAAANIAGNLLGSHTAIKKGDALVRSIVLISLTILFIYLLVKYFDI